MIFSGKFFGVIIAIVAISGAYFGIKVLPPLFGNADLEKEMRDCLSEFVQYRRTGCKARFQKIIDEAELQISAEDIRIEGAGVGHNMVMSVEYEQEIYFPFDKVYVLELEAFAEGRVPERY